MHLALGNGEFASFKVSDYAAYERQTRRCWRRWSRPASAGTRRPSRTPNRSSTAPSAGGANGAPAAGDGDDDLSLVAGMTTSQRRALKAAGISTRRGFAGLADLPELAG